MGQCIAVVSGKGGTGKTSFTAGVGAALALSGLRVLCVDCDIGLRNLDIALGLSDAALMDFSDVAQQRWTLERAVVSHPQLAKLSLLTAPIRQRGQPVTGEQMASLLRAVRIQYDFCLLDAPAGLGGSYHSGCLLPAGCPAHGDGAGPLWSRKAPSGGQPGPEKAAAQYARHY